MSEKLRLYNAAITFNWFALAIWFLVGLTTGKIEAAVLLGLISACWIVPMNLATIRARNELSMGIQRSHLALAICSIIFIWVIPGILILVAYTMCGMCNMHSQQVPPVESNGPSVSS